MNYSVRQNIIENLIKDVYGPRNGSTELLKTSDVSSEYIIGTIIPEACALDNDFQNIAVGDVSTDDGGISADDPGDDDYRPAESGKISPYKRPSVFSISFKISESSPEICVYITYGMYSKCDNGWKRQPFQWCKKIKLDDINEDCYNLPHDRDSGNLIFKLRKINDGVITATFINRLKPPSCKKISEFTVFQPSMRINIRNGKLENTAKIDNETSFLLRDKKIFGRGYLCSAIWKDIDYSDFIDKNVLWPDGAFFDAKKFWKCDIRSEFIPLMGMSSPILKAEDLSDNFANLTLSPEELSNMYIPGKIRKNFEKIADCYNKWIEENIRTLQQNNPDKDLSDKIISKEKDFLAKFKEGIDVLEVDENARLAFLFANRVIAVQNKEMKWYPFQIAYIISVIPSLVTDKRDEMELLSIPTGGGKTEAYLFLTLFIACYRRIKYGDYGTAVFSRYTLRLLTIQQFRRAVKTMAAAELVRISGWKPAGYSGDNSKPLFGVVRYSAGLWVGNSITPHLLRKDENSALEQLSKDKNSGSSETAQIIRCPFCGTYLSIQGNSIDENEFPVYLTYRYPDDINEITVNKIKDRINSEKEPASTKTDEIINTAEVLQTRENNIIIIKIIKIKGAGRNDIGSAFDIINCDMIKCGAWFLPLHFTNPGYFGTGNEPGRIKNDEVHYLNFEIYCPNPDCVLNTVESDYFEYEPSDKGWSKKVDGELPFYGKRVPVPALTVDEQIYSYPPSIVIGTVDKVARMAYDPLIATLTGNVSGYNHFYGYNRNNRYFSDTTKKGKINTIHVKKFIPPDMVIQDELHLIEGPLGSMVGIYENMLDSLLSTDGKKPKYIASTATLKGGTNQVRKVFNRKLVEFPPPGINFNDYFFIKYRNYNDIWDENIPGKLFAGISSPGITAQTLSMRIMASILNTNISLADKLEFRDSLKYYWTVVNYYNSLKELGNGESLLDEDVIERLQAMGNGNTDLVHSYMELSGRIPSSDLPDILENLSSMKNNNITSNITSILATSMFGTGIDLPGLSSMIVTGQPKTTSQYIQATGRIGRSHGGLVITLLSAGKPRDLSHYELFPQYHLRYLEEVEEIPVSPFSTGSILKAAGPVMISYLRNMPDPESAWYSTDKKPCTAPDINSACSLNDIKKMKDVMYKRIKEAENEFQKPVEQFENELQKLQKSNETPLLFYKYVSNYNKDEKYSVILGTPRDEYNSNVSIIYHKAPQSMREIDESLSLSTGKKDDVQLLRQTHFIYSYGPGSIIESLNGPRYIPSLIKGLRNDTIIDLADGSELRKRSILNRQLVNFISKVSKDRDVRLFEIPTNESLDMDSHDYIYRTIEFPKWKICYGKHNTNTSILFENPKGKCPVCGSKKYQSAVRFISVCSNGHLDDLPWYYLLHGDSSCSCDHFDWKASGPSLKDITVKCPKCGKSRTMAQIYGIPFKCSGNDPEGKKETCDKKPKIVQRQETNVRYPFTVTVLDIPEKLSTLETLLLLPEFRSFYSSATDMAKVMGYNDGKLIDYMNKLIDDHKFSDSEKQLLKQYMEKNGVEKLFEKYQELTLPDDGITFMNLIQKEYNSIKNLILSASGENEAFRISKCKNVSMPSYEMDLKIHAIDMIKTVSCNIGYRRLDPEGKIIYSNINNSGCSYYPSIRGTGEGIFIEVELGSEIMNNKEDFKDANTLWEFKNNALFIKVHTFAHALIKKISLKSGYSSSALRERIYIDKEDVKHAGILIYTATPGEDGSMGGLTDQIDEMEDTVKRAIDSIKYCSNDPLCIETKNEDGGSACYSCVMLSETSCEHMNSGLDRKYFTGN
jgi:hypothetical protein